MGIGPPIQDGRSYICASRSAGLNLWLAMIQEGYGVTALVGQELLSGKLGQVQCAMRLSHEAMNHVVRIEVKSGDRPVRSNAVDVRTLTRARARTRNVELNERAVFIADEAVIHVCLINIPSRDRAALIDSKRICALERTWDVTRVRRIKRSDETMPVPQETVTHIVRIKIVSHDGSIRSKAPAKSTLARTGARARNIECRNEAPLIPQETVVPVGPVIVESCDFPIYANCERKRTRAGFRTRHIERGKGAISISEEAVTNKGRVNVPSRDRPIRVHDQGAERKRALTGPSACPRRIEDGNHSLIGANIAVEHIACVTEESRNGPTRVYGVGPRPLAGPRARTRRVEDDETIVLGPDETVPHIVRVTAESYDRPRRADVCSIGALKGPRAGTRRVKGGNGLRRH
jgi:hypothetical protein